MMRMAEFSICARKTVVHAKCHPSCLNFGSNGGAAGLANCGWDEGRLLPLVPAVLTVLWLNAMQGSSSKPGVKMWSFIFDS